MYNLSAGIFAVAEFSCLFMLLSVVVSACSALHRSKQQSFEHNFFLRPLRNELNDTYLLAATLAGNTQTVRGRSRGSQQKWIEFTVECRKADTVVSCRVVCPQHWVEKASSGKCHRTLYGSIFCQQHWHCFHFNKMYYAWPVARNSHGNFSAAKVHKSSGWSLEENSFVRLFPGSFIVSNPPSSCLLVTLYTNTGNMAIMQISSRTTTISAIRRRNAVVVPLSRATGWNCHPLEPVVVFPW